MAKIYDNKITTTSGFKFNANAPLDDRDVVELYADLVGLNSYEGMRVYVVEHKKDYQLIDGVWTTYEETDPTVPAWAKTSTKPTYTASEVGALPDNTVLADLSSDSAHRTVTDAEKETWNAKSDFSGSYNDLTNKPTIPTVPTKISAFENDKGYLTSYTETDPTVPSWAKASSKPTYTASEVGALPDTTVIPDALSDLTDDAAHRTVSDTEKATWNAKSDFSGSYNDLTNKPTIPSIVGLATETYVDNKVAGIVDSSPEALNTLNELAAALGDDPNFATTVSTEIGKKVDKTTTVNGHALSGNVTVTKSDVGLGNVPNVATNDQTPTFTEATTLENIATGEKVSTLFGKIKKAITDLIAHLVNKSNPHGVTKTQVGLGNVEDKSSATIRGELTSANVTTALGYTPLDKEDAYEHPASHPVDMITGLAKVATSGSYKDLADQPTIPSLEGYAKTSEIPIKVSELDNDKGYLTEHQSLEDYAKTADIPTKVSQLENDKKYLTEVPSEFVTEEELTAKGYLTEHQSLDGYAKTGDIPTKVSQLENDKKYLTEVPSEYVTEAELENKKYLSSIPEEYVTEEELSAKGYLTEHQKLDEYAKRTELFSKNYNDLTNKPDIPDTLADLTSDSTHRTVTDTEKTTWNAKSNFSGSYDDLTNKPTKISVFENDKGYLTSYTETDPTVPSHVKKITETDISNWNAKSEFSGSYTDLTNKPTIPTVPTKVSAFTNDAGYLTSYTETDPTVPTHVKSITIDDITNWNSKSTFNGNYDSLTNKPTIPTVNNATLTIQKNGTIVKTFTANSATDVTANITVPTALSGLTDDSTHRTVTDTEKETWNAKSEFSGSYNDLTGIPTSFTPSTHGHNLGEISDTTSYVRMTSAERTKLSGIASGAEVNVQSDWNQTTTTADDYIKNKPTLGSLASKSVVSKTDLASSVQTSLGKADTALQSFTETDPTVPSHVKNITEDDISSWNAKSEFSGNYNDLTNKPTIPSAYTHPSSHPATMITGLATVATSGKYSDLSGAPTSMTPTAHNQASNTINAMTGYSKPSSTGAIGTSDTLNAAIGKLEKALDGKQASGSYSTTGHKHTKSEITDFPASMTPTAHNQAANTINAMTGYSKPSSTGAIAATDTLNAAIGKLEKALDGKQASGSYSTTGHKHTKSEITDFPALATVATSGSYNDLSNKPTIPAAVTVDSALSSTSTNPVQNKVINSALAGKAASSHGNHVPATETANNAKFLRNDNTWQTVTPANIGAAAASHGTHVTYATATPSANGIAAVGTSSKVAREDHVHPLQTTVSGKAGSADKLNTNAGSATQPVYFANGIPVATTYTLGASVPSDAKFTDTTYDTATASADGLMSAADKVKLDGINIYSDGTTLYIET